MADPKISEFTALPGVSVDVDADVLAIVDASAGIAGTKKISVRELIANTPAFLPSGTGAIATTVEAGLNWRRNVFGSMTAAQIADVQAGTASLNLTSVFVTALAAVPTGGALVFPYGTYLGVISVRRSNITLIFEGCAIKMPAGTPTAAVLELGDWASGNGATAYEKINIVGQVLLDGNKANVTAPTGDITAWGFAACNVSNSDWGDGVRAKNCHNGGVGIAINCDFNKGSFYVESCGNATHTGPGFDINSSHYSDFTFLSKNCYAGGRVLDNCWGLNVRGSVYNPTVAGFIYNNQAVNSSFTNNIDVVVYTAGGNGITIGPNCKNGNIRAAVYNATSYGCQVGDGTGNPATNNTIDLATYNSGLAGLYLATDANDNTIRHQSNLDGRSGAQGSSFAVDVNGNRNKLSVSLTDSATWQVRGIAIRAGALDNEIASYSFTNTVDSYNDQAATNRTKFNAGMGRGTDIASAATITIPVLGTIFHVTGNTGITAATGANMTKHLTLVFDSTPTVTKGSNLKLGAGGNLVATANSTLNCFWDGTNLYETGRSVN